MNKENLEKFLQKAHIPISKEFVNSNIVFSFFANMILFYFFRNIIVGIISGICFVIYTIILIQNKRYLRECYNSLLVKTWLTGYLFWLLLIFTVLLQIFFKIGIWYYVFEGIMLVLCLIFIKKRINNTFEKAEFKIDFTNFGKSFFPIAILAYLVVHFFLIIFKPPFIENIAWYILSSIVFMITIVFEAVFISEITVFCGYKKYFGNV